MDEVLPEPTWRTHWNASRTLDTPVWWWWGTRRRKDYLRSNFARNRHHTGECPRKLEHCQLPDLKTRFLKALTWKKMRIVKQTRQKDSTNPWNKLYIFVAHQDHFPDPQFQIILIVWPHILLSWSLINRWFIISLLPCCQIWSLHLYNHKFAVLYFLLYPYCSVGGLSFQISSFIQPGLTLNAEQDQITSKLTSTSPTKTRGV